MEKKDVTQNFHQCVSKRESRHKKEKYDEELWSHMVEKKTPSISDIMLQISKKITTTKLFSLT